MDAVERKERWQRVRIGLTGLAFVFLLVLLGTAISRSSDDGSEQGGNSANLAISDPDDPLAQIGAAPGVAKDENALAEEPGDKDPAAK